MATNKILTFATGAAGTNILSDTQYAVDAQRTSGNVPGIARQELVNKVLLQTSVIAAGIAQYLASIQTLDITDALTPAQIAAMLGGGRLVRTLLYKRVGGVQAVSINGTAFVTGATANSYTPGPGVTLVEGEILGGGGSGGSAQGTGAGAISAGGGGAGGGWARFLVPAGSIPAASAVTIGLGGFANVPGLAPGLAGSVTSLGTLIQAAGGAGGQGGPATGSLPFFSTGGSGGTITGSFTTLMLAYGIGEAGGLGLYMQLGNIGSGKGGGTYYGDGGQASGVPSGVSANGNPAPSPGAGGSGGVCLPNAAAGASGGAGADGQLIIREFV